MFTIWPPRNKLTSSLKLYKSQSNSVTSVTLPCDLHHSVSRSSATLVVAPGYIYRNFRFKPGSSICPVTPDGATELPLTRAQRIRKGEPLPSQADDKIS